MIILLVAYVFELLWRQPIVGAGKEILKMFSFIEMFVEVALLIALVVVIIMASIDAYVEFNGFKIKMKKD